MSQNTKIDYLNLLRYDEESAAKVYRCPLCGGEIKVHDNVFYGKCDACSATLIDYKPAPHQVAFHESKAKFRLNIGGFGSGRQNHNGRLRGVKPCPIYTKW